jgi:hypothetical protein
MRQSKMVRSYFNQSSTRRLGTRETDLQIHCPDRSMCLAQSTEFLGCASVKWYDRPIAEEFNQCREPIIDWDLKLNVPEPMNHG